MLPSVSAHPWGEGLKNRIQRGLCLILAALLLTLSACGGPEPEPTPTPGPVPTVDVTSAPEVVFTLPKTEGSMDPILSRDKINLSLAGLIWEGLFALDRNFAPQPVLCQSYTTAEDGLTWTFTLAAGVTFSDGSPLTAEDVAASLLRAKGEGSRYAARMVDIRTIRAVEGAVVLTLAAPNGALPALLDMPIVRGEGDEAVGTGPYVLSGTGEEAALIARTAWWSGKGTTPPLEDIPLRTIPEADDLIYAFDTGDISLVTADLTGPSALGYGGDNHEAKDYPTTTMEFVGYNCAKGVCRDPLVRQALSRGFDRNTVAVALYARHAQAAALPIHPEAADYSPGAAELSGYDTQAMADLLTQAGYQKDEDGRLAKGRSKLALTMLVNTDNSFRMAVADYLAGELEKAGITVDLQKLSWADYQKALEQGAFDLYLGATAMTGDFDPTPLTRGELNYGSYWSTETNELLSAYRAASGPARTQAADAFYRKLAEEVPFTALCFKSESVLTQWGAVSGMNPTQQNPFYGIETWRIGR